MSAVRAAGFAEPISLAEGWQRRADALYAEINAMGFVPGCIGLLADGRMGVIARKPLETVELFAIVEARAA
jgi:hypothetical protein